VVRRLAAVSLAVALGPLVLTGCGGSGDSQPQQPQSVTRADLEHEVARRYPPQDPGTPVDVVCAGDLTAGVGASQTCHLLVGKDPADVRVRVTDVTDGRVRLDTSPYLTSARVARKLLPALLDDGYTVDSLVCTEELPGTVGAHVSCLARSVRGAADVEARVASVRGLDVELRYQVGS
jgi:hypothetical protein